MLVVSLSSLRGARNNRTILLFTVLCNLLTPCFLQEYYPGKVILQGALT